MSKRCVSRTSIVPAIGSSSSVIQCPPPGSSPGRTLPRPTGPAAPPRGSATARYPGLSCGLSGGEMPSPDHRFILDLVLPHTPPDDGPRRGRTLGIRSRSSGGARADGEGDAHLVADGVQGGLIGDAVVAAVNDELASGHQRRTGQVDVHRDGDLARDAVQGEPAEDGGASAGALHAQALEGDRGELPDVEEVLAAQVVVAHPDSRVDGGASMESVTLAVVRSLWSTTTSPARRW